MDISQGNSPTVNSKMNIFQSFSALPAFLFLLSSSLYFAPAFAIESNGNGTLSEEDFLADIPVVLTATRLAQPIAEAPAAITIIDRQMIRASGAREIADLFRMVPGFVVSHDSGHVPIVAYHGLSDEYVPRMQLLVDGRSVYSPIFGGVDWTNLPLTMDDIERIEVIRGPNAASYGSNSFFSIINIITQHASETTGTFIRGIYGSNGARDATVRYGNTTGDFDYRLTVGTNSDKGFEARADDRHMKSARFRSDYQVNASDNLMFQAGLTRGDREIDSKSLSAIEDRHIKINFEQIRWMRQIGNSNALSLQFFHTVEDSEEIFDAIVPGLGHVVRDTSTRAERVDFELQHTKQIRENTRLVWGLGVRQDSAKGPQIFGTDPALGYTGNKEYFYNQMYRLFSNLEWRARKGLTFNLGLMLEDSDLADKKLSPRFGINYAITPKQSIRYVISRATRTPSLNEKKSNFQIPIEGIPSQPISFVTVVWVGNNNVKPEEITSYELAYHANFLHKKLSFDLKLFHEDLRGLITIDETSVPAPTDFIDFEAAIYDNLTDANIEGIEANLDFSPSQNSRIVFSRSLTNIDSDNPNVSSEKLAESGPKHITSILAINRFANGITASILHYRVSESNGLGSGKLLPGYRHINLRLAFPFKAPQVSGEVAFVVQNYGDEYLDWRSDNTAETQQFVTISAQFD